MKATEANLLAFLRKSPQFVIPIYQRTYSWTERECKQLWDDILRAGSNDAVSAHFIGSIVYIEKGLYQVSSQTPLLVIDGQQRLTTATLLIAALANKLEKPTQSKNGGNSLAQQTSQQEPPENEPYEGFSPRKLRNYYLLNPEEKDERKHKLILSQTDKESLTAIVTQQPQPQKPSLRVTQNFDVFKTWIDAMGDNLVPLCKGLAKLVVVDISLSREQDNPPLIFESMNSTGRELTQADLIRNFVLMGLEPELQTRLYVQHWRPMELDFGQESYGTHFDSFMRHYLTVKTGEIPRLGEVYEAFKKHARAPQIAAAGVETLVCELHTYAGYFCAMALGVERESDLKHAFNDIREMKVDVAYPFLLELYHDYKTSTLPREEFLAALRLVEAYVFRRATCAIPTNSLNKTFATFTSALKKDRYLESIQAHLLRMPSYRRFPTDDEFKREFQIRDLYNSPRRSYWLRRLENHDRKERVPVDEYTIEHILPQNPNLSPEWQVALGPEWLRIQETWLHTCGNLTLTGYNSEYSDRPFPEKRDMDGGFKSSPLKLNQGLGQLDKWDETAIKDRANKLAVLATDVWRSPDLPRDILEAYRPQAAQTGYTIEDHPQIATGPMREVFMAFRKEVVALDPCVTEDFLKLYVAFKAETNFVDVVPQAKRLRLTLNMTFPEIMDPRSLCRDVTGLGRWGNGDVEVSLASLDELPNVMGLVRQALEKQMGNGDA